MPPAGSREPVPSQYFFLSCEHDAYLKLNLGLSDVSLATASAGDLLCLANLVPDSLSRHQSNFLSFIICAHTSALKSSNG
jgi:hypothetical protein